MPRLARLDAPGVLQHVMGHAISWIGIRELGYSGADVARYLGVTNSCITRMVLATEKSDIDDIDLEL